MKVQFYTTAPECYDYAWTKALVDELATDERGRYLRLVEVEDEYHAESQMARYGSGNYYVREKGEFLKDVESGFIKMNSTPKHYYRCHFDLFDYHDWTEGRQDAFHELRNRHDGHLKPARGGLIQRIEIRGDKALFDRIVNDFFLIGVEAVL